MARNKKAPRASPWKIMLNPRFMGLGPHTRELFISYSIHAGRRIEYFLHKLPRRSFVSLFLLTLRRLCDRTFATEIIESHRTQFQFSVGVCSKTSNRSRITSIWRKLSLRGYCFFFRIIATPVYVLELQNRIVLIKILNWRSNYFLRLKFDLIKFNNSLKFN